MNRAFRVAIAVLAWMVSAIAMLKSFSLAITPIAIAHLVAGQAPLRAFLSPAAYPWELFCVGLLIYWIGFHVLLIQFARARRLTRMFSGLLLLVLALLLTQTIFNEIEATKVYWWFGVECVPNVIIFVALLFVCRPLGPPVKFERSPA